MKLVLVVPSPPNLATAFADQTVVELLSRGWDAHLLYDRSKLKHRHGWQRFLEDLRRGWDAHPSGELSENGRRRDPRLLGRVHHADVRPADLAPDIVHFTLGSTPRRVPGAKVVAGVDGAALVTEADALQLPEQILPIAPPSVPCAVVPPAVDAAFFGEVARSQGERVLRVLTVGALDWRRGYEYAFHAVRLLLDRGLGCEYRVVGDGEFADALGFARHQLGVNRAVELTACIDVISLRAQLEWADVYLCPGLVDGISTAIPYAQAMSLPVVATHGRMPRDIVPDGTGFLVPRRDAVAMADKLERLGDPILRRRLGRAGHAVARARYAPARTAALLDELYRRVYVPA